VVEDARGRDWLMYHGMHPKDSVYVGRQALLDEVKWNANGWPVINEGKGPSARADAPLANRQLNAEYNFFDDFLTPRIRPGWQWPQANEPVISFESESVNSLGRARKGWLVLAPTEAQAANLTGAVVARSTTVGDYTATTLVETSRLTGGARAGLSAFGEMENALGLSVGDGKVVLWRREKNEQRNLETIDAPPGASLLLRMRASNGHRYRFSVSTDGRNWKDVGDEIEGDYLPPWDRGVRVALTAGGARGASGRFGFLRIEPSR
jgi:beta-xylosidase